MTIAPVVRRTGVVHHHGTGGGGGGGGSSQPLQPTMWSDKAVDIQGVNMHLTYTTTMYGKAGPGEPTPAQTMIDGLKQSGIRHARETLSVGNTTQRQIAAAIANAIPGFTWMFCAGYATSPTPSSAPGFVTEVATYHAAYTDMLEGTNEPDHLYHTTAPPSGWDTNNYNFQVQLFNAARSQLPNLKVGTMPMAFTNRWSMISAVGSLQNYCDTLNIHVYPGGNKPNTGIDSMITAASTVATGKPVWVTEGGYEEAINFTGGNPPVTEDVAASYEPQLVMEHLRRGTVRYYKYEWYDENQDTALSNREQHFGRIAWDDTTAPSFRQKPEFLAIANMNAILGDYGSTYSPYSFSCSNPTMVNDDGTLRYLFLQNRNGVNFICLWRDISIWDLNGSATSGGTAGSANPPTPLNVTVQLGVTPTSADYIIPKNSTNAYSAGNTGTSHTVGVGSDLVIIRVNP